MLVFPNYCAPYMYRGELNRSNFIWSPSVPKGPHRFVKVCTGENGEELDLVITNDKPDNKLKTFVDRQQRAGYLFEASWLDKYTSATWTVSFYQSGTKIPVKVKSVFLAWMFHAHGQSKWTFHTKPSAYVKGGYLRVSEEKERFIVSGGKAPAPWVTTSIQVPANVMKPIAAHTLATRYDMVHNISFHFYTAKAGGRGSPGFSIRMYGSAVFGDPSFKSLPPPPTTPTPSPPWPSAPVPTPPATGPMEYFNEDCIPYVFSTWKGPRNGWEDFLPNASAGGVWREVCTDSKGMSIDMQLSADRLGHPVLIQPSHPISVQAVRGGAQIRLGMLKSYTSPKLTFSFYKNRTKIPVKVKSVTLYWFFCAKNGWFFDTVPTAFKQGGRVSATKTKEHLRVSSQCTYGIWTNDTGHIPKSELNRISPYMMATRWDIVHNITFRINAPTDTYYYGHGVDGSNFKLPTPPPTPSPTESPTSEPTPEPTLSPTESPTPEPTESPTPEPTESPTPEPTESPTPEPTESPTPEPTESPTPERTESPTPEPTESPTPEPTESPTTEPTESPTESPTPVPTESLVPGSTPAPTDSLTPMPTQSLTPSPTTLPTKSPEFSPTGSPTRSSTAPPTPKHICLGIFGNTQRQHQIVDALNGNKAMVSIKECDTDQDKFLTIVGKHKIIVPRLQHEASPDAQSFGVEAGPDPGSVSFVKFTPVHWICERGTSLKMCTSPTSFRPELRPTR